MPFGWVTWVGPRHHVLDGGPDPPRGRGNFGGCLAHCHHWKALQVASAVYMNAATKSITASARLLQPTALLLTGRCHINFPPVKNPPPVMQPIVRILWSRAYCVIVLNLSTANDNPFIAFPLLCRCIVGRYFALLLIIIITLTIIAAFLSLASQREAVRLIKTSDVKASRPDWPPGQKFGLGLKTFWPQVNSAFRGR